MNEKEKQFLQDIQEDLTTNFVDLLDRIKERCQNELGWSEVEFNHVVLKWMMSIVRDSLDHGLEALKHVKEPEEDEQ